MADPYFGSVFPTIGHIEDEDYYRFNLSSEGEENIRLNFGGNVASFRSQQFLFWVQDMTI